MSNPDHPYAAVQAHARAQAKALRDQAEQGGLRFEAYLPPRLALWLLERVEREVFLDPSEAVFVLLGEAQDLEPHQDLRKEILRRSLQAAIDDPRPGITGEEFSAKLKVKMRKALLEPAVWTKYRDCPESDEEG